MPAQTTLQRSVSSQNRARGAQPGSHLVSKPLGESIELIGAPMPFARNEEIYGDGESADYLYKVISGAVRTYKVLNDGRRQIGAFYLPGDIFGLESGAEHALSAEAITNSRILVIKRSAVTALATRDNTVAQQLLGMTTRELARAQNQIMLLIKTAQERSPPFCSKWPIASTGTTRSSFRCLARISPIISVSRSKPCRAR